MVYVVGVLIRIEYSFLADDYTSYYRAYVVLTYYIHF